MAEIVNGARVTQAEPHVKKSRSRFPIQFLNFDTHRFGEYHPHVCIDGEGADVLPVRCTHDARSYTLKAPLMQDIQMHKDYFMVNLRAILPFNGEKYYTNPVIGEDIPIDAGLCVEEFLDKIRLIDSRFKDCTDIIFTEEDDSYAELLATLILKRAIFLESVFSSGCLLSSLGCHLHKILDVYRSTTYFTIDSMIDDLALKMSEDFIDSRVVIDGTPYNLGLENNFDVTYKSKSTLSVRTFLEKIRDTADWHFDSLPGGIALDELSAYDFDTQYVTSEVFSLDLDLRRLWAYHLAIAEYMTDDHVDYIYNAELFRQYIFSLIKDPLDARYAETFSLNGLDIPYDYLSAHFFNVSVGLLTGYSVEDIADVQLWESDIVSILQYFTTLFGYERSLRFKDYFVGARTRPLAVGDTNITVNAGKVNVVDVSRNIQVQRFLNAINASGRKFGEYISALFGVTPTKDMHEPIFLAHTSDGLFASENENTGNAQFDDVSAEGNLSTMKNSVTAVFRGNSGNYEMTVEPNEPCVIIGITSYDIERAYTDGIDKTFFIKDRFDMFLPQLQFVGDQPIDKGEINASAAGGTFGYTFHDMQYKIIPSRAQGGFVNGCLPGYAFLCDNKDYDIANPISPDFIRARPHELDKFYLSLTGYSLGTYFHFIVKQKIYINASRPMAAQPQIL